MRLVWKKKMIRNLIFKLKNLFSYNRCDICRKFDVCDIVDISVPTNLKKWIAGESDEETVIRTKVCSYCLDSNFKANSNGKEKSL